MTVTFQNPKLGLYLEPGSLYCGDIVIADIGVPNVVMERLKSCLLYTSNQLKNRDEVVAFKRSITQSVVIRSAMILFINLFSLVIGLFILTLSEKATFLHLFFEAVSAMATVGLSANVTPTLTVVGKVVIILLMYIGRIGVITCLLYTSRCV